MNTYTKKEMQKAKLWIDVYDVIVIDEFSTVEGKLKLLKGYEGKFVRRVPAKYVETFGQSYVLKFNFSGAEQLSDDAPFYEWEFHSGFPIGTNYRPFSYFKNDTRVASNKFFILHIEIEEPAI